jgi:hypothetical protein
MRSMTVTQEHVDYLNKNCMFGNYEDHSNDWLVATPFVVSLNQERTYWNKRLVQTFSEFTERDIVKVQAIDWIQKDVSSAGSNSHLNHIELDKLSKLVVDNCLQYELSLVIGMNLVVLENMYKTLGVVNGAEVKLQKIHYDNRSHPIALEVIVSGKDFKIDSLLPNTVWIERKKTQCSFLKLDGTKVQIQRNQFPVTEGFASTAHKKQGSTLSRAVISLSNGRGVASYVKLSRTKRTADTYILEEISLKDLKINPPSGWLQFNEHMRMKSLLTTHYADQIAEIISLE